MKLGEIEFHIVCVGHVRLDGGAMSGVIPRPLWEKKIPPDARNRITLAVNCLLIHAGDKRIPVETGGGADKWDAKLRDIYAIEQSRLVTGLREYGLRPEDIDIVVNDRLAADSARGTYNAIFLATLATIISKAHCDISRGFGINA